MLSTSHLFYQVTKSNTKNLINLLSHSIISLALFTILHYNIEHKFDIIERWQSYEAKPKN